MICRGTKSEQAKQPSGGKPAQRKYTNGINRRAILSSMGVIAGIDLAMCREEALALPFGLFEPKGPKLPPNVVLDKTLAYTFTYPLKTASGRELPIVASRKPEKYSSAAPLVADARQRIVAEYVSLADGVTYSVFVGPAVPGLQKIAQSEWTARTVATSVLSDRSANRNTSGQKLPIAFVESAEAIEKSDGVTYYIYETSQSGSPTIFDRSRDTTRQGMSVTAARSGLDGTPFLYTLALTCPGTAWDELEEGFRDAVQSFTLLSPGDSYIPPDKDPWNIF